MTKFAVVPALALLIFASAAFAADIMLAGGSTTVMLLGRVFDGR